MVPSGIVTPVFAFGAVLGRLFGEIVVLCGGGTELAGGYAVVGAAAFTAGITGTVSIAVIVFELTSQLSYMLPVLLCVLVGRSVTLWRSLDMYETMARLKKLPQWPNLTKQEAYVLTAPDLMRESHPSESIPRRQTREELKQWLEDAPEDVAFFPLVDDRRTQVFLGAVTRDELESILEQWDRYCTDSSQSSAKASVLAELEDHPIDLVQRGLLRLDATQVCHVSQDTSAGQVILLISVYKCPQLFVTARGRLVGVIHAADLLARSRRFTL